MAGSRLSATIQAFSSSVQRRRRPTPVITSSRRKPSSLVLVIRLSLRIGAGPASRLGSFILVLVSRPARCPSDNAYPAAADVAPRRASADRRDPGPWSAHRDHLLRIAGLARDRHFINFHRVLNRAAWCPGRAPTCCSGCCSTPSCRPVPSSLASTTRSSAAAASGSRQGIYRDPVRSSRGHLVKASGLRWLSLMLLAPIPGRDGSGPCRSSPLSPLPSGTAASGAGGTSRCSMGANSPCRPAAGCPGARLCWWATAASPPWSSSRRSPGGLTASPACGSTRPSTNLAAAAARTVGRPRTGGARLPYLADVLADAGTGWAEILVTGWYGAGERMVEICSGTVAARRPAGRANWMGSVRYPATSTPRPSSAPTRRTTRANRLLVRPALAGGGHLPGGPRPPRRRDAAAMVGPGDRPRHALPARPVLARIAARRAPDPAPARPCPRTHGTAEPHPTLVDALAAVRRQLWREQGLLTSRRRSEATKLSPALRHGIAYALCHAA